MADPFLGKMTLISTGWAGGIEFCLAVAFLAVRTLGVATGRKVGDDVAELFLTPWAIVAEVTASAVRTLGVFHWLHSL